MPELFGDLRLAVQPAREHLELLRLDLTLLNALWKALEEGGQKVFAPDVPHRGSAAVEAAGQSFPQLRGLGRVFGPHQPFREQTELLGADAPLLRARRTLRSRE